MENSKLENLVMMIINVKQNLKIYEMNLVAMTHGIV